MCHLFYFSTRLESYLTSILSSTQFLDCEPLHDLKGHLINMCKELPYLLTGNTRKTCEDIITATISDKMTCADHRILILNLYSCTITDGDHPPSLCKYGESRKDFSQVRKTTTATSNRHPENIISSLVIRLQAKTEQ